MASKINSIDIQMAQMANVDPDTFDLESGVRNGKEVRPVKYFGKNAGHGTYMAGSIDGQLVTDSTGRPIPYKAI